MSVVCDCDCVGFEASQVPRGRDRPTTRMTIMRKRHRDRNRKKNRRHCVRCVIKKLWKHRKIGLDCCDGRKRNHEEKHRTVNKNEGRIGDPLIEISRNTKTKQKKWGEGMGM